MLTFTTLAEIKAHQWVGYYHADSDAFNAIEAFAADPANSMQDRAEALWVMGRNGMGLDPAENCEHVAPEQLVAEFMRFHGL